jgi:hypothetical protein
LDGFFEFCLNFLEDEIEVGGRLHLPHDLGQLPDEVELLKFQL